MNIEYIEAHHTILAWQERWLIEIDRYMETELSKLQHELDAELDKLSVKDIIFTDSFIKEKLDPIISEWKKNTVNHIVPQSERDLPRAPEKFIGSHSDNGMATPSLMDKLSGLASAIIPSGIAIAAVPTTVSLSSVSTVGVVDILGTTTISLPVVLAGAAVIGTAGYFAKDKITNLKSNQKQQLKEKITCNIYQDILFNKAETALRQMLRKTIEQTTESYLKELSEVSHAA